MIVDGDTAADDDDDDAADAAADDDDVVVVVVDVGVDVDDEIVTVEKRTETQIKGT